MKIHENLKKEGKSCKNCKPRGGVEVRSILHSSGILNSCQIVQLVLYFGVQLIKMNIFVWILWGYLYGVGIYAYIIIYF